MTFETRRAECPLTDVEIIMADVHVLGDRLTDCFFQAVIAENFLTKEGFPLPPKHTMPGTPFGFDLVRYAADCVGDAREQIKRIIKESNGEVYY